MSNSHLASSGRGRAFQRRPFCAGLGRREAGSGGKRQGLQNSAWHWNCSVIEPWSCLGLLVSQSERVLAAAEPLFSFPRSAESPNCETEAGGKLSGCPCSAGMGHG